MAERDNPLIARKYKSKRWQKLRRQKLLINPMCQRCEKKEKYVVAYIVHHKEHITEQNYEDDNVFFNIDNLESVCLVCHNKIHFEKEVEYKFDENGDLIKNE